MTTASGAKPEKQRPASGRREPNAAVDFYQFWLNTDDRDVVAH
jgi:tyrosyl-tRNA synthetase